SPVLFSHRDGHHPHLHSFPTRRSSDLSPARAVCSRSTGDSRCPVARVSTTRSRTFSSNTSSLRITSPGWSAPLEICAVSTMANRSEEHTSELQSRENLVCRLLLEKKKK